MSRSTSPTSITLAANCVGDGAIPPGEIGYTKLEQHLHAESVELAEQATVITALEKLAHVALAAGTVVAGKLFLVLKATDVSRTVDVDLQRSTAGGAFATILTATTQFTSSSANLTAVSVSIDPVKKNYIAGDCFKWVVTVAGGSGTQAKGLIATGFFAEAPE